MVVKLIRVESGKEGTFGVLLMNNEAFCVTLEPEYKNNTEFISCIPIGTYLCKRTVSPRYGDIFEIKDVPNRKNVLFHAGNRDVDTEGCVLLAQYFGKLYGDRAVLNSGTTFRAFMNKLEGQMSFALQIIEV